jgi:hypothetical protein
VIDVARALRDANPGIKAHRHLYLHLREFSGIRDCSPTPYKQSDHPQRGSNSGAKVSERAS